MSERIQQQIQIRLKAFDDVFHNVIITLERLERFLLAEELYEGLDITAVRSERDFHDDEKNPPTIKLLYGETQLQCSALFYQTKFDDEELFHKTVSYFLKDLLMWYGGRKENIPYDDVDRFFIPVVSALDRQVHDVRQVMQTVHKYVRDIENDISQFSEEEKEKSVHEGFGAWLRAQDIVEKHYAAFMEKGDDVVFTVHQRGTVEEGLQRLYNAFIEIYTEKTPLLFLESTRKKYLWDIHFDPVVHLSNQIFKNRKA
ncbi:hypothetical protein [Chryseobacterium limigenitum]|uniref:Uncharacterized protein n=1 Tax=Chryseobacterium limigenitum TaxID=1612149 RepID=A0A1K2IS50_9FLAO|nr:hypothetical protein [Chryseobacterium limigenitum]SFZ95257.1 hypothetical protein SAMN05216324_10923 [Chryseobacterium limigenitum]